MMSTLTALIALTFAFFISPIAILMSLPNIIYFLENKGFVKMSDDDKISLDILSILKSIDPENIKYNGEYKPLVKLSSDFSIRISNVTTMKIYEYVSENGNQIMISVNDNPLVISNRRQNNIIELVKKIYIEEMERIRIQEISTDLGI